MKKTILLFIAVFMASFTYAQKYDFFNYKMLITDNGTALANQTIDVKISLRLSGATNNEVWVEEHSVTTDDNGICSLFIGNGNRVGGSVTNFEDIHWTTYLDSPVQLKVEVDTGSGYQTLVNWEDIGSVPTAKEADRAFSLEDQYETTKYIGSGGILKFMNTSNSVNSYKIGLDSSDRLSFTYNSTEELMYFQGGAYTNFIKDVKMESKLLAPESGDSDLKPYLYGKVYASGSVPPNGQSNTEGFTVTKTATGVYQIMFDTPLNSYYDYFAVASIYGSSVGMIKTTNSPSYLEVRTFDTNGNLANRDFTFVIFKK